MEKITPNMAEVIGNIGNNDTYGHSQAQVIIFAGRMSKTTYYSILGGSAQCASTDSNFHKQIPDDTFIVAVSNGRGTGQRVSRLGDNEKYFDGFIGYRPYRFRVIDITKLYLTGDSFFRFPELGINIGMHRTEVERCNFIRVVSDLSDYSDNLVGGVLLPVIEPEDESTKYFINYLGETVSLPTRTTLETNLPAGLYDWQGRGNAITLGPIKDHLYVDEESLKNDVVLYRTKKEASKYVKNKDYYDSLDASAKAEQTRAARDLTEVKTDTALIENDSKREVLSAKTAYETGSLGRKDSYEETSHGRNILIASMAAGTAAVGLLAKLGSTMTLTDIVVGSITSTGVACGIVGSLAFGVIGITPLGDILKSIIITAGDVGVSILGGAVRGACNIVGGIVSAGYNAICSVGRGLGSLFGY